MTRLNKSVGMHTLTAASLVVGSFSTAIPAKADWWSRNIAPIGHAIDKAKNDAGTTVQKAAQDAGNTGEKALHDTGNTAQKAVQDAGQTGEKALHDAGNTIQKAAQDAGNTGEKALHDTGHAIEKGTQDLGTAGETIGRFVEREIKGLGQSLSDADQRIREGKIVDAIWHLGTDPVKNTEANAAKAAQESNILRTVGQVAATAYGGPGGAAAYAAWYTFRTTGDVEMALRVGLITGAASAGFSAAAKMPVEPGAQMAQQIAKKVLVTGAIGGLAVAAAGGDEEAIKEGFLMSGGMVLVQTGYEQATHHKLDRPALRASKGDAYCMATVGGACSPPKSAYLTDTNGNIRYDKQGNPLVDVRKTDVLRPHVGTWSKANDTPLIGVGERSASMTAVSKIPGMNAMALFHDHWAVSWDMNAFTSATSIVPAVVLTYTGTGAPFFDHLEQTATKDQPKSNLAN